MLSFQSALLASRRARRGVAMLEILFALSIIAFLGLGALYLYNQATTGNRNRTAISQIQNVQQSVRTLYAGQSDYGAANADITPIVAASKTLPGNMIAGTGTTLKNVFGGTVTVTAFAAGGAPAGLPAQAGPTFTVTFTGIPAESCSTLATADNGGAASGLIGVSNGSTVKAPPLALSAVVVNNGLCPPGNTTPGQLIFAYQ